jgi:hypothetical protein
MSSLKNKIVCNELLQTNFTGGRPPEGGTKWKTRPCLMRRRNLLVRRPVLLILKIM